MIAQNIIASILVICAVLFLTKKYFIKPKKSLQGNINSPKSSSCGCGSTCPIKMSKK